jgi:hypothetical protein
MKNFPVVSLLLLGFATATLPRAVAAENEIVTTQLIYTPAVVVIPEVRAPDGALRTYRTANGVSYWQAGLPVYKGDAVKLNVFVSTGGADLAETRVRLDNVEISRRTEAPWNVSLDTGDMAEGFHHVEAWARTGGDEPRSATATVVFFVDPRQASQATTASPIVETIAAPEGEDPAPAIAPDEGGPAVQLSANSPAAQKALETGARVPISAPVTFTVSGPGPEEGYVYALYRGAEEIHRSKVLPLGTKVKLRPDAPDAPGLLPGVVRFVVWGADKRGRLGPPRVTEVEIPAKG